MIEQFKNFVNAVYPLSESEWRLILPFFEEVHFSKNEIILKEGEVCEHLYFLSEGIMRYYIDINGTEKTKYFTFPPYLFTAQQSWSSQTPTRENIQAITKAQGLSIHFEAAQSIQRLVPNWRLFIYKHIQHVQLLTENLLLATQMETAESRYQALLKSKPTIIQQIPLKYLASYLGIKPESLSRIRKKT